MTARQTLDAAAAKYRRTYDRLYIASQKGEFVDAKLAEANREYDAAKTAYAEATGAAA